MSRHRERNAVISSVAALVAAVVVVVGVAAAAAELEVGFYDWTCPEAAEIVQRGVQAAMRRDPRMPASLLRLHFHDCFVNGCDGSNLLDDRPGFVGEKSAAPNLNSARGFEVIDEIKQQLEAVCPATVSCADIVATVARDSVFLSGGPFWEMELGRRDALTTTVSAAANGIPTPNYTVPELIASFNAVGLDEKDVVALSGSHTIGQARCTTFQARLYNQGGSSKPDPAMDVSCLSALQQLCPENGDGNVTALLEPWSPTKFDNLYYKALKAKKGLLFSDQALEAETTRTTTTMALVEAYADDEQLFFGDFVVSMLKMAASRVVVGNEGEVRRNCRVPN